MSARDTTSDARLRAALGDVGCADDPSSADWADGFGIVVPDVQRYADVLREVPDALLLAMQNIAAAEGLALLEGGAARLISVIAHAQHPRSVLEVGTGIGYVTLHLARAVADDCTIRSVDMDPVLQGRAHAFFEREAPGCVIELRLGASLALVDAARDMPWDLVVLTDASRPRQDIVDRVIDQLAPGGLLLIPGALHGGRVAQPDILPIGLPLVEAQRSLNRSIAAEPRLEDVVLLPVGDGLLIARRKA